MDFRVIEMPLPFGPEKSQVKVPRFLIVHSMAEYVDYGNGKILHAVECHRDLELSAHYYVTPSGVIIKSRGDYDGAWHALGYNYTSIGVEFLVPGVYTLPQFESRIRSPYITDLQRRHGWKLVRHLVRKLNLEMRRHSDVDPKRKVDPGDGFPWADLCQVVGVYK